MAEQMLVTQGLDERDLLAKKIRDKIDNATFIDSIRNNEDKTMESRVSKAEFTKSAKASYQQIMDLINRFQKIDAAIIESNAKTIVETSYGKLTVAGAISLRNRLRGVGSYNDEANFEKKLRYKM